MAGNNYINPDRALKGTVDFERMYIASRQKEGRLYSDEQVKELPDIEVAHMHHSEWLIRKKSAMRLFNYLKKKRRLLKILEVGCGNGWLTALLSRIKDSRVTGSDINKTELEQAKRVFNNLQGVEFVQDTIGDPYFNDKKYDIIIFAASIQYFPCFEETIRLVQRMLQDNGEIHIIDTHFYKDCETASARKRSALYYESSGYPAMSAFYFHHTTDMLTAFKYEVQFSPVTITNRLFNTRGIFPWIRIVQ